MAQVSDHILFQKYIAIEGKPFLKHLDYFKSDGEITKCSIRDKWSALSGENRLKTYIKADITIRGANKFNPDYQNGSCPWKSRFESADMMEILKHPCDTGIVNIDGSINIEILTNFVNEYFEPLNTDTWILRESVMNEYLRICLERDHNLTLKPFYTLPSFETLAKFEWYDFFLNFNDGQIDGTNIVNLETFLQFYFEPDVLYQRILNQ